MPPVRTASLQLPKPPYTVDAAGNATLAGTLTVNGATALLPTVYASGNVNTTAAFLNSTSGSTGLRFPTSTSVALRTNGVDAVTIDASQYATFAAGTNITQASLGRSDAANYAAGTYWETDLLGMDPFTQFIAGGGLYGFQLPTPAAVPTIPAGWTAAQLGPRTGLMFVQTTAVNDSVCFGIGNPNATRMMTYSVDPGWTYLVKFGFPNALSSATDRYLFEVGFAQPNSNFNWLGAAMLRYSDNQNGGNWILGEQLPGSTLFTTISNSTVAPVANSWNTLQVTKQAGTKLITATLNGSVIASGNGFIAHDPMFLGGPLMCLNRSSSAGTLAITAFMDYASFYSTASTRT